MAEMYNMNRNFLATQGILQQILADRGGTTTWTLVPSRAGCPKGSFSSSSNCMKSHSYCSCTKSTWTIHTREVNHEWCEGFKGTIEHENAEAQNS